jgi:hypothetical protein
VLLEDSRGRKFTKLVADHILGNEHGVEDLPVVHQERMPDEVRMVERRDQVLIGFFAPASFIFSIFSIR